MKQLCYHLNLQVSLSSNLKVSDQMCKLDLLVGILILCTHIVDHHQCRAKGLPLTEMLARLPVKLMLLFNRPVACCEPQPHLLVSMATAEMFRTSASINRFCPFTAVAEVVFQPRFHQRDHHERPEERTLEALKEMA